MRNARLREFYGEYRMEFVKDEIRHLNPDWYDFRLTTSATDKFMRLIRQKSRIVYSESHIPKPLPNESCINSDLNSRFISNKSNEPRIFSTNTQTIKEQ